MFGKPGRPPEDRLQRQLEIWAAVGRLIETHGARNLTMRQAAAASFLSLGGLYHYFPSKRALVFFGMDSEAIHRACNDFLAHRSPQAETDPQAAAEWIINFLVRMRSIVRPAVLTAVQMGSQVSTSWLESTINMGDAALDSFFNILRLALPGATDLDLRVVASSLRRLRLTGLLDESMTQSEYEEQLRALFGGVPVDGTPTLAAS